MHDVWLLITGSIPIVGSAQHLTIPQLHAGRVTSTASILRPTARLTYLKLLKLLHFALTCVVCVHYFHYQVKTSTMMISCISHFLSTCKNVIFTTTANSVAHVNMFLKPIKLFQKL